ncbi:MAG: trehalase family glycosidase [Acidobacteriota bacterium]|nr:trehalase family glycosidase [Acidobacteriota bacterium]
MRVAMHVGALEARRWAGLVLSPGPGRGVGVRLAFVTPAGERREWDDWYRMVSRVGPHAWDFSYARVDFALSPESPPASALVLEWSRREDAVALRVRVEAAGRLELIGDVPWGWEGRWEETGPGSPGWRARVPGGESGEDLEIVATFAGGTGRQQTPGDSGREVVWRLETGAGVAAQVVMVAAWGGKATGPRLGEADAWIDAARAAWERRRPRVPGCPDLAESIADNLMWTVLLQPETGRLYTPAGRRWIFPIPDSGTGPGVPEPDDWTIFGWDTFFNALLLATVSGDLAWSTLLAGTGTQYPNGNIPNWRSRRGGTRDRSQPPVGSFAALRLYRAHPDPEALGAAYPALLAWADWWVADKNGRPRREGLTPGLLAWGSDTDLVPGPGRVPPWEEGATGHQRAAWESGQDDLPLWDEADWDSRRQVLAMSAVDLCSYRALDLESLSRIARVVGDGSTAERLAAEYRRLAATMNRVLWSEASGLYLDELPSGPSARVAASNFLPLVAGIPDARQAARMIETLRDPTRFWGDWVLPTISRDDPAFADQQYWRGSIWPPMNYLVLQGLRRYGFTALAAELARKGADMFLADRSRTGSCRENFDARTGEGGGQRFQSWAPLFALGAVEELGARADP